MTAAERPTGNVSAANFSSKTKLIYATSCRSFAKARAESIAQALGPHHCYGDWGRETNYVTFRTEWALFAADPGDPGAKRANQVSA